MARSPRDAQHLRDLALLRRVRDRMDREYTQPLDVEALASGVDMSAGHLSRQFRAAYGERGEAGHETGQESRSAGPKPSLG